jgi:hypothetical protein
LRLGGQHEQQREEQAPPNFADSLVPHGGERRVRNGQNRAKTLAHQSHAGETEAMEVHVKRLVILIIAIATPLSAAERNSVVDEVIRLWKANVAEETIIQYVQKADARFTVSADDVIDMAEAKVPRTVIKAVLDEADARGDRSREERRPVYVPRYYGWYNSSLYDPWFYNPWYGGPRFSIGIGFGHGRYYGGPFRGRHFRRHR